MNVIEASALSKRYRHTWALRDCDLSVPPGYVTALVGPNGAGKTTLLRLLAGLMTPTAGSLALLGGHQPGSGAVRDDVSYLDQQLPLYRNLQVRNILRVAADLNNRWDQGLAEKRLAEWGVPLRRRAAGQPRPAGPPGGHGGADDQRRSGRRCRPAGRTGQSVFFAGDTVHLLLAVPPTAALFAGLPWLTREFETGSFRYTWVQGISPVRWLLGVFGSLAALAAVAAAVCGVVFNWWYRFAQWPANITPARGWDWDAFGLSPIALAGWTVFAMALATLFAALLRRTVPAMAAFAVTYAGCLLFGLYWFRPWLLSLFPAVTRQNGLFVTGPTNQVDYYVTTWTTGAGGHVLTEQQEVAASIAADRHADPGQWLAAQHYVSWLSYQPHSRLAFFQLALTLVLLVLSALLVLATVRLIRWGTRRSLPTSIAAMTSSKPCALT